MQRKRVLSTLTLDIAECGKGGIPLREREREDRKRRRERRKFP
jgi:hypothetical protein